MSGQIHSTKNYDIFKPLPFNRGRQKINNAHLKELEKSIIERNLLPYRPIIVNEELTIIDGHHRLEVAKRHNLEIFYTIAPDAGFEDATRLTRGTTDWSLISYIEAYAGHGNLHYQKLDAFLKNENVPIHNLLRLLNTSGYKRNFTPKLKHGKFIFDERISEMSCYIRKIHQIIATLKALGYNKNTINKGEFWLACYMFLKHPDVNWELFEKKLQKYASKVSQEYSSWRVVAHSFVDIYNVEIKKDKMPMIFVKDITG